MQYKILDSGAGQKLEQFGSIIMTRPSLTAIWPRRSPLLWKESVAEYQRSGDSGSWCYKRSVPEEWEINLYGVSCILKWTSFGHVGVFPEHTGFWPNMKLREGFRVLNLFAYTGATSIFCAKMGAKVFHVDASKAAIKWAQRNVDRNSLPEKRIYWVVEDALSFLQKEARRGKTYDAILLDPPTYGRGPGGEIFRIDRDFFTMLDLCAQLLSDNFSYLLVTSHTPGHTPEFLRAMVSRAFPGLKQWHCGESFCGFGREALPSGVFALWNG